MKLSTVMRIALAPLAFALGSAIASPTISDAATNAGAETQSSTQSDVSSSEGFAIMLGRAQAKLARAQQIANRFSAEASNRGMGENWQYVLINNLMRSDEQGINLAELSPDFDSARSAATAGMKRQGEATRNAAMAEMTGNVQAKSLGTATSDLVYVPLTPCRILDTRAGSPVSAGTSQSFYFDAANTGAGSCSVDSQIPGGYVVTPAAEAINVTVVSGAFSGGAFLSVYPDGGSKTTSWMNYTGNQTVANAGVISINGSNAKFDIFAQQTTNVIVDAFGLFLPPQATALDCVNTAYSAPVSFSSSVRTGNVNAPVCATGYTRVSVFQNANGDYANLFTTIAGDGFVYWNYLGSSTASGELAAKCCRVPGR